MPSSRARTRPRQADSLRLPLRFVPALCPGAAIALLLGVRPALLLLLEQPWRELASTSLVRRLFGTANAGVCRHPDPGCA